MTKDKEYPQYNEEDSGILTALLTTLSAHAAIG